MCSTSEFVRPAGSTATAFSSERLKSRSATQVGRMSPRKSFSILLSLLSFAVFFQSASLSLIFPVENEQEIVHFRSLRDILFRSQYDKFPIDSESIVASFRPAVPSPTLASSSQSKVVDPSVTKIRFLESDALYDPPVFASAQSEFTPIIPHHIEGRRSNSPNAALTDSLILVRKANEAANPSSTVISAITTSTDDRWPWPYSGSTKPQQSPTVQSRSSSHKSPALIVKKLVAKPYRVQSKTSSCPKLLHDLTVKCSLPNKPEQSQQVEFQWYKTQHRSSASTTQIADSVKIPVAYGNQVIHKDPRFGVSVAADSSTLTIRQLKPQDCGSYVCEALDAYNTTVLYSSEFLIFLCY